MNNKIVYDEYSNFNVALISPYRDMAEQFTDIAKKNNTKAYIEIASLNDAANIAKKLENKVDVILSRGGTAEYIRESVGIPVVSIQVTAFDVLRSIHNAKKFGNEAAVFTYGKTIIGIKDIEDILQIKIYEYTFISENEIEKNMKNVKNKGVRVIVGGMPAVQAAKKYGITGILIKCGEEAIQQSLEEAIHIVEIRNAEAERSARLKVILNSITQGIIVTDEYNKIMLCNPAAEKIFNVSVKELIGESVAETIPNSRMHNVLESGEAEIGALQDINGGTIATNRIPIEVCGKRIGVVSTFEDITKIQQLEQKIREKMYKKGFIAKYKFDDILTSNPDIIELKKITNLYAKTDAAILIQGESGTGKELFAQSIHNVSDRCNGPFVAVNCAAIPDNLLESELFGYEGGAFTGAKKDGKQGLFELAHNGTIFLDEIGELSKVLQARLLRVIQEKEIMRVGGDKVIPIDIRIISATNQDLQKQIENEEFRQDLYYRLNVFNIALPPLRERKDDIGLIAGKLLRKFVGNNFDVSRIINGLNPLLTAYDWPGNVRELNNIIERFSLVILQTKTNDWSEVLKRVMNISAADNDYVTLKVNVKKGLKPAIKEAEKSIIGHMLLKYNQDKDRVIEELKIGRATFWRKI